MAALCQNGSKYSVPSALADMETVITWCKEQIVLASYEIE